MDATDRELIDRFRGGDRGAFAGLVVRWDRKAYALAYRLTQDAEAAEDIRQAAFVRAYEGLGRFNGQASFSTWLYRIVVNLSRDRRRSRRKRDAALRATVEGRSRRRPDPPSPAAVCEHQETSRRVAVAVANLPVDIREVVVMRHYQGLRFAEIAEVVGAPESTVKSRMGRGLRLLRDALEEVR